MRRVLLLTSFAALVMCGCSGSDDEKIVGEWRGEFASNGGKTILGANVTFDKDHKFRLLYGNLELTGTWTFAKPTISLIQEKVNGMGVDQVRQRLNNGAARSKNPQAVRSMAQGFDKPVLLTLADDGKTMSSGNDSAAGGHVVYRKQ